MPLLRRHLVNLLTLLSLLLCVTFVVLSVRSLRGPPWDEAYAVRATESYGVGMEYAGAIAFLQRLRPEYGDNDPDDVWIDGGGFRYVRITSAGMRRWNLALPAWFLVVITAALPLARTARRMGTRNRRRPGHCPACGYDLTGNVSGVCPECGKGVGA
jgi:hypothetical protein